MAQVTMRVFLYKSGGSETALFCFFQHFWSSVVRNAQRLFTVMFHVKLVSDLKGVCPHVSFRLS